MKEIEAIRAALNEWRTATTLAESWDAEDKYSDATDQDVMVEVLAHIDAQAAEIERLRVDAERYKWLRKQHWNEGPIAVVVSPKKHTRLGAICPSLELLDDTIDHMRKETP